MLNIFPVTHTSDTKLWSQQGLGAALVPDKKLVQCHGQKICSVTPKMFSFQSILSICLSSGTSAAALNSWLSLKKKIGLKVDSHLSTGGALSFVKRSHLLQVEVEQVAFGESFSTAGTNELTRVGMTLKSNQSISQLSTNTFGQATQQRQLQWLWMIEPPVQVTIVMNDPLRVLRSQILLLSKEVQLIPTYGGCSRYKNHDNLQSKTYMGFLQVTQN